MNVLTLLTMPLQARTGDQSLYDAYGLFVSASPLPDNVTPIATTSVAASSAAQPAAEADKVRVSR